MDLPEDVGRWPLDRLLATLVPVDVARRLATEERLACLSRPGLGGAVALEGLDQAARVRVAAAFELGRRRARLKLEAARGVAGPGDLGRLLLPLLEDEDVEIFLVALFDGRHRLTGTMRVSRGTLTGSLVHPREVFRPAVAAGAAALAVAHNHPSGDPTPSSEDRAVTRRLAEVGQLLGIPLLDHLVIGREGVRSLRAVLPSLFSATRVPEEVRALETAPEKTPTEAPAASWTSFETADGPVGLVLVGDRLERLLAPGYSVEEVEQGFVEQGLKRLEPAEEPAWVARLREAIAAFFEGDPLDPALLDVPLTERRLPPFRAAVYEALRRVPRGRSVTYAGLAAAAGSPRAARAVGSAMAANDYPLLIPCHRVIGSGGSLAGYSAAGGVAFKERLLRLEGAWPPTPDDVQG